MMQEKISQPWRWKMR